MSQAFKKSNLCKVKASYEECKVFVFICVHHLTEIWNISAVTILTYFGVSFSYLSLQFPGSSLLFCGIVFQLFSLFSMNLYLPYGRHHWQETCGGSVTKFWVKWEIRCRDFLCETFVFLTLCWKYESALVLSWWVREWRGKHFMRGSEKSLHIVWISMAVKVRKW